MPAFSVPSHLMLQPSSLLHPRALSHRQTLAYPLMLLHPAPFSATRLRSAIHRLPDLPFTSSLVPVTPFQPLSPPSVSVGLSGLEPLTPALSAQCSNQLSYRPFYLSHTPTHNFCATRIATFTSTLLSLRVPDFSGGSHPQGLHPAVRIPASNAHSSLSPK